MPLTRLFWVKAAHSFSYTTDPKIDVHVIKTLENNAEQIIYELYQEWHFCEDMN